MPAVPDDAIQAAAEVLRDRYDKPVLDASEFTSFAAEILEAAAPAMAEAVAAKILAHRDKYWPAIRNEDPDGAESMERVVRRAPRRHLGIAARVAAKAFYTDEDLKRLAAEALARGDYIARDLPEEDAEPREDEDRD